MDELPNPHLFHLHGWRSSIKITSSSLPPQYMLNSTENPGNEDVLDYGVLSESDSVSKHFFLINPNPIRVSRPTKPVLESFLKPVLNLCATRLKTGLTYPPLLSHVLFSNLFWTCVTGSFGLTLTPSFPVSMPFSNLLNLCVTGLKNRFDLVSACFFYYQRLFQITIVSFLVSDSIPFTSVELLQIKPANMSVEGAEDRIQIIGKKQGAKGPVSTAKPLKTCLKIKDDSL